jgi:hypothetical protein
LGNDAKSIIFDFNENRGKFPDKGVEKVFQNQFLGNDAKSLLFRAKILKSFGKKVEFFFV